MKKLPIMVAIPLIEDKVISGALMNEIERIAASTARGMELRLDYAEDIAAIDLNGIVRSIQSFDLDTICTCRIKKEGGNFCPRDQEEQEIIMKKMISAAPRYIDIELSTEPDFLNMVLNDCDRNGVGTILSHHDFAGTPNIDDLDKLLRSINEKIDLLNLPTNNPVILKAIFTANSVVDNLVPMNVIESLGARGFEVISFCMGITGIISRVASVLPRVDGKPSGVLTYASLDQATALGQLDLGTMEAILSPFF